MSFLRPKSNAAQIPLYTGLQVQTSSNAVPIQIVYGANKVAPNIMWTGNFRYTTQKAKGGKGGGQDKPQAIITPAVSLSGFPRGRLRVWAWSGTARPSPTFGI